MIPRREALAFWLKLGFISFGGPAGQIAIMHQELVERRRWISERRFLHALNYCMVLPGPEAQQLATYLGWLMHGTWGGVAAGVLFVLPGMLLLMALAWMYLAWADAGWMSALFYGVKPAVVAIVLAAAWRIGSRSLRTPLAIGIAVASLLATAVGNAPFPAVVLAAALIGFIASKAWPAQLAGGGGGHAAAAPSAGAALIDDDTPTPAHARHTLAGLLVHAGSAMALWATAFTACILAVGMNGGLTRMAWFFTKAAFLTIGGAYAVLPYVYDGAVEQFGWVRPEQMIDGLALGETTPGPLILVVTFVGFLGGWQQALLGPDNLPGAALAGGLVATFFTFLPSFLFILAGGPLVEATRQEMRITAPLAAITAAVVGVILNLALLFARHTFWPGATSALPDFVSIGLAVAAGVALLRFKVSVPLLVVVAAGLGLVLRQLPIPS